jgi:hypothetical protein
MGAFSWWHLFGKTGDAWNEAGEIPGQLSLIFWVKSTPLLLSGCYCTHWCFVCGRQSDSTRYRNECRDRQNGIHPSKEIPDVQDLDSANFPDLSGRSWVRIGWSQHHGMFAKHSPSINSGGRDVRGALKISRLRLGNGSPSPMEINLRLQPYLGKVRYLKDHFRGMNPFASIQSQLFSPRYKVTQLQAILVFEMLLPAKI